MSHLSKQENLSPQTVAVWVIEFSRILPDTCSMATLLSPEEKLRSKSFYFDSDAQRYICSHGVLRTILGFYTDQSPHLIPFCYGAKGKPRLDLPGQIQFNISHTKDLLAIAVTSGCNVGVDIESCVQFSNMKGVAKEIMRHSEYLTYLSLRSEEQVEYFYRCWVKKEAVTKAWGSGLISDLREFSVMGKEWKNKEKTCILSDNSGQRTWCVTDFEIKGQHAGAICLEGNHLEKQIIEDDIMDSLFPEPNYSL